MLVASDLNGTLTTGSPVLAVHRWLSEHQPDSCPPLFKYKLIISYLQVKVGLKKIDTWGKEAMSAVLNLIQKPDLNMLDEIMDFVVEDELWPKSRFEPIRFLRELLNKGSEIIVISAAYQPAVEKFARKIAPVKTFGIGTPVEITDDGIQLAGPFNSRDVKMHNLLSAIGSRKLDLALGDTFADIPMLEKAENAIAVHPDRKLMGTARERGWQIMD